MDDEESYQKTGNRILTNSNSHNISLGHFNDTPILEKEMKDEAIDYESEGYAVYDLFSAFVNAIKINNHESNRVKDLTSDKKLDHFLTT